MRFPNHSDLGVVTIEGVGDFRVSLDRLDPDAADDGGYAVLWRQSLDRVNRLRKSLAQARLELMQDVDPDAIIVGIDAALEANEPPKDRQPLEKP